MKKNKLPHVAENTWVYPISKNYKFICCDCGLVHSMDFESVILVPAGRKGKHGEECVVYGTPKAFSVRFRVRRDDRRTAKVRKECNYTLSK